MTELDYYSIINTAARKALRQGREEGEAEGFAKGEAKGREEGKAEGKAERNYELAKAMKVKGLSIMDIAEITGLSIENVEML